MTGIISWFERDRGYGCIAPGGTLPEVWFHVDACDETWSGRRPWVGDRVSFDETITKDGLTATRVTLLGARVRPGVHRRPARRAA